VEVIDPNEDFLGGGELTTPKQSLDKKFLYFKSEKRDFDYVSVMRIKKKINLDDY
jgi:hypothetical protein